MGRMNLLMRSSYLLTVASTHRGLLLVDRLSSEIEETISGCLARALPRVATDLRLPIAISELGKGLVSGNSQNLFNDFFLLFCYRST